MSISVIVPYYNDYSTIYSCLNSVISEIKDIAGSEIIIVDDGSTENIDLSIIKDYSYTAVKVIKQPNQGVSQARNRGATEAANEIIMFCDADDFWISGKVAAQIEMLKTPGVDVVGSAWNDRRYPFSQSSKPRTYLKKFLLPLCWWPHISTLAIRKNIFIKIGGFDSNMRYAEDGDFLLKLLNADYRILLINHSYMEQHSFRSRKPSDGLSSNKLAMTHGEFTAVRQNFNFFPTRLFFFTIIVSKFLIRLLKNFSRQDNK